MLKIKITTPVKTKEIILMLCKFNLEKKLLYAHENSVLIFRSNCFKTKILFDPIISF